MSELVPASGGSPFDRIKQTRSDGSEFWSARQLQGLMGYTQWRNLQPAIARAMQTANNTGMDVARDFAGSRKISGTKPADDFELSREAAYLVAMNGDPNKPEVAAAQAYFAARTIESEKPTASTALDLTSLDGIGQVIEAAKQAHRLAIEESERADREAVRAELERQRNSEYEHAEAITITTWRKAWFSYVPEDDFWDCMYDEKRAGLLINQRLTRPKLDRGGNPVFKGGEQVFKDGYEHRHPTARGQKFLELVPNGVHGGKARYITKVIPGKDAELALRNYLSRWFGLGRSQIEGAA